MPRHLALANQVAGENTNERFKYHIEYSSTSISFSNQISTSGHVSRVVISASPHAHATANPTLTSGVDILKQEDRCLIAWIICKPLTLYLQWSEL